MEDDVRDPEEEALDRRVVEPVRRLDSLPDLLRDRPIAEEEIGRTAWSGLDEQEREQQDAEQKRNGGREPARDEAEEAQGATQYRSRPASGSDGTPISTP